MKKLYSMLVLACAMITRTEAAQEPVNVFTTSEVAAISTLTPRTVSVTGSDTQISLLDMAALAGSTAPMGYLEPTTQNPTTQTLTQPMYAGSDLVATSYNWEINTNTNTHDFSAKFVKFSHLNLLKNDVVIGSVILNPIILMNDEHAALRALFQLGLVPTDANHNFELAKSQYTVGEKGIASYKIAILPEVMEKETFEKADLKALHTAIIDQFRGNDLLKKLINEKTAHSVILSIAFPTSNPADPYPTPSTYAQNTRDALLELGALSVNNSSPYYGPTPYGSPTPTDMEELFLIKL